MTAPARAAAELDVVERALHVACGFSLSPAIRRTLPARVDAAAEALGVEREALLAGIAREDPAHVEALVEACIVGETYFFRHPEHFAALRELARARAPRDPLSIWSAACASGEEPYSIAIALLECGRPRGLDAVIASDVSRRQLRAAKAGRYGEWSLRRLDPETRRRWFVQSGESLSIADAPRAMVRFAAHNLARQPPPGGPFDVVMCRNVLIYFDRETARAVIERIHGAMRPGGLLFLGSVEVPLAAEVPFEAVEIAGAPVLRRPVAAPAREARGSVARIRGNGAATRRAPRPAAAPAAPAPSPAAAPPADPAPPPARQAPEIPPAEHFLALALDADARGDLDGALIAMRRALYLDPSFAAAHAHLVGMFQRLGRPADAERSRANALDALRALDDRAAVAGFDNVTAGTLRNALGGGRPD